MSEYTLIDLDTSLIYGPYERLQQAQAKAADFKRWEILDAQHRIVDWGCEIRPGDMVIPFG